MIFPQPIVHHPTNIGIGPLTLSGFGLGMFMCFVMGQWVMQRLMIRRGLDPAPVPDMIFAAVVSGLLGGKLYYVMVLGNWEALFQRYGFVYWGGFIVAMFTVMGVVRYKRLGIMRMSDIAAAGCAAAYAVGRTGCWAIGDDYGRPWTGFLAVAFPEGSPASTAGVMAREFGTVFPPGTASSTVISVIPTQLMHVAIGLLVFLVIWRLKDHRHAEGWLFGVYLVLAGMERFIVEFFRAKDDMSPFGITYAQVIALAMMVGGFVWMRMRDRVGPGRPGVGGEALAAT